MKKITLILICFHTVITYAQDHENNQEVFKPHHSIALILGHTNTGQGTEDGENKWLSLPSWALDYNYYFNSKWSLGLHNDMILETFKVKDHKTDQESIERTRPIACVVVVSYKPGKHFSFELGAGGEFAKEENFLLSRVGVEYSMELVHTWELISNITYDLKWQAYNSMTIGVGISKAFGFRKK